MACPLPSNLFEWHYCIYGLTDCPYEGGYYHGKVLFPPEYPSKPPGIVMLTPSGRFEVDKRICLSISDYHPESWNPAWNMQTIMIGLISFMNSNDITAGSVVTTDYEKIAYAKNSLAFNMKTPIFKKLFESHFSKMEIKEAKI